MRRLAMGLVLLALGGCGSNGGGGADEPFAPDAAVRVSSRGVPVRLTAAGDGRTAAIEPAVAGDQVLLILAAPRASRSVVRVTVNGGGRLLGDLAVSASRSGGRHAAVSRAVDPEYFRFLGGTPRIEAELGYEGPACLVYRDQATPAGALAPADLTDLGRTVEESVLPLIGERFGEPSDVDSNGRVTVLLTPRVAPPKYGYFYLGDLESGVTGNLADMIYCRVPRPSQGETYAAMRRALLATLTHELQHLVSYAHKGVALNLGAEQSWLNEGLSFLAEDFAGLVDTAGGSPENVAEYFSSPESFTLLETSGSYDDGHAGAGYLFCRYLADRFGDDVARRLVGSAVTGTANVEAACGVAFETLFVDWALAVWLAGTGLTAEPRYDLPGFATRSATYLDGAVSLDGPRATPVDADSGEPGFAVDLPGGAVRYLLLDDLSRDGTILRVQAADSAGVQAALVRLPTSS